VDRNTLFTATCTLQDVDADVGIVRVVEGPDKGVEHPFAGDAISLGSSRSASMHLGDRGVSRLHAQLTRIPEGIRLEDLGSKNGTWLAGCRIERAVVGAGTTFQIGSTVLEVRLDRRRLKQAVWNGGERFGNLLGSSPAMHRLFASLARVSPGDSSVLVTGESGTGKEEIARAIHAHSARKDGPFVVVDGASLSKTLADLELFGHQRGAFTGADLERAGAFERAHGGTVFLDEIGELPIEVQPKLLRVLEDRTVQRLGDGERRFVDVRIVAATHRSLARMVNEGSFREDLLYRLAVLEVSVPPLRERGEDVRLLGRHFLRRTAPEQRELFERLDQELEKQRGYRWPGNVRELRSFVRRLVALGEAQLGAPSVGPRCRRPSASTCRSRTPRRSGSAPSSDSTSRGYSTSAAATSRRRAAAAGWRDHGCTS